jgi:hypothetical protein
MKQVPSTISTEDLLKELEKIPEVVEDVKPKIPEKNEILNFLYTFNIEPGNFEIERKIIYNLYKNYSDKPLSEKKFYKRLQQYLTTTKGKRTRIFFNINQKSLDLSQKVTNLLKPKTRPSTKMIPLQMHFDNFVKKYGLKAGKKPNFIWVSVKVLYDMYDEWVYQIRKKKPLGYKEFVNFCKIYFPISKEGDGKVWLMLNDSASETIKARNSFKNEKEKKSKK